MQTPYTYYVRILCKGIFAALKDRIRVQLSIHLLVVNIHQKEFQILYY